MTCVATLRDPYEGTFRCVLSVGHAGEHEDDEGHWWPTDDQLAAGF